MSFPPSDPTSGFTSPSGWEPHDDAAAIGAILRGEGEPAEDPDPTEDPAVNVVGSFRRAFPGGGDILPAMGAGASTFSNADRAGVLIYQVTNTDDSGSGSFRQAMNDAWNADQDALKIIVFKTGGYISLSSRIQLPTTSVDAALRRLRNIYVAGQTAPGDGITFRQSGSYKSMLMEYQYDCEDFIIRGVRFRYGAVAEASDSGGPLWFRQCDRMVLDLCSFSWSPGRTLSISAQDIGRSEHVRSWTVQRCCFAEPLQPHDSVVSQAGGFDPDGYLARLGDIPSKHGTFYQNIVQSGEKRCPNMTGFMYGEIINNLVYNTAQDASWFANADINDYVANVIRIHGPWTGRDNYAVVGIRNSDIFKRRNYYQEIGPPSFYVAQNIVLGDGSAVPHWLEDVDADNWSNDVISLNRTGSQGIVDWAGSSMQEEGDLDVQNETQGFTGLLEFRRLKRWHEIGPGDREWDVVQHDGQYPFPVEIVDPYTVEPIVDEHAGCSWRVNSAGQWVQDRRDAIDARLATERTNGTGLTSTPTSNPSSYPVLDPGTAPTDSNGDGIPDDYYNAMGGAAEGYDPAGASKAAEIGHDGYTFVENYINGRDHHTGAMRFG